MSKDQQTVPVSSTFKDFQTVCEGEIWCLCTVTFDQKNSKLYGRAVYCSQLYGIFKDLGNFKDLCICRDPCIFKQCQYFMAL